MISIQHDSILIYIYCESFRLNRSQSYFWQFSARRLLVNQTELISTLSAFKLYYKFLCYFFFQFWFPFCSSLAKVGFFFFFLCARHSHSHSLSHGICQNSAIWNVEYSFWMTTKTAWYSRN